MKKYKLRSLLFSQLHIAGDLKCWVTKYVHKNKFHLFYIHFA